MDVIDGCLLYLLCEFVYYVSAYCCLIGTSQNANHKVLYLQECTDSMLDQLDQQLTISESECKDYRLQSKTYVHLFYCYHKQRYKNVHIIAYRKVMLLQ